ncbi:Protein kinase-like domain [Cordyceps militaris CM01]|uniref:Protein kinase-like domain n=1 Tax=Cordyceps militaris (strain CM01) TaxID=983644 RepID=G3JRP8_CORMM|nr:Protein kinase-like domain [Cordyceps militaris CM01]EGX88438.1 Protein kinase-like domain [Cordyceps militaris CM01]
MPSQPINDRLVVRWAVIILYWLLSFRCFRRLFPRAGPVLFLSSRLCIKSTRSTSLAEASAMRFIAAHTTIPVPKVHSAFEHQGIVYIVMERINGVMLAHGWLQRTPASQSRILESLRGMVQQMRQIPAPAGCGVSNVDGGAIYDPRLPGSGVWGPFQTIHDFHRELRAGVDEPEYAGTAIPELGPLIAFHNQPWPYPVFSHGDLSSLNVLADGDEVVGIVDWETAAWMPPYWEYTSAWHVNPYNQFWQAEVDRFLEPLPEALAMEIIRRKYHNDY